MWTLLCADHNGRSTARHTRSKDFAARNAEKTCRKCHGNTEDESSSKTFAEYSPCYDSADFYHGGNFMAWSLKRCAIFVTLLVFTASIQAQQARSVNQGVYTDEQAKRG